MPMRYNYDQYLHGLLQQMERRWNARSLNLGGSPTGNGGPPGGFVGYLPQTRVAYDNVELETDYTPASGYSIVDNLNHIRYRLSVVESGGGIAGNVGANELAFGDGSDGLTSNPLIYVLDSYQTGYKSFNINTNNDAYDYHQYFSLNIGVDPDTNLSNLALWSYGYEANLGFFTANGTEASPSPLASGDEFGLITFNGWCTQYGGSWMGGTEITAVAAENWEGDFPNTKAGSRLEFDVLMPGTTYQRKALKLEWDNATFYQNAQIALDGGYYLGDRITDGSWRIIASGESLLDQKREGGDWVTKTVSGSGISSVHINASEIGFGSPTDELTSNPYTRLIEDEGYQNYPYLLIGTSTTNPDILSKYGSTITIVYDNSDVEASTTDFELYGYDTYQSIMFTREGGTEASPASIDPNDIVGGIYFYGRGTWEWEGHSTQALDLGLGYFEVTALETPYEWMSSDMMTNVYSTNSKLAWRICPSGPGYPSDAFSIVRDLAYFRDDVQMELDSAFYFGSRTADGSWRIIPSGADLLTQKRESGSWVTKHTIS